MPVKHRRCPHCGQKIKEYLHPFPTVDIIIEMPGGGIVLIKRKNPPHGWALPGGFVDYGESLEQAAIREAKEETSLHIILASQFHTYSDPKIPENIPSALFLLPAPRAHPPPPMTPKGSEFLPA